MAKSNYFAVLLTSGIYELLKERVQVISYLSGPLFRRGLIHGNANRKLQRHRAVFDLVAACCETLLCFVLIFVVL